MLRSLCLIVLLSLGHGFTTLAPNQQYPVRCNQHIHRPQRDKPWVLRKGSHSSLNMGFLEGFGEAVKARQDCPPQVCLENLLLDNIRRANILEPILHWFHPLSMVAIFLPLALTGAYTGLQVRLARTTSSPLSADPQKIDVQIDDVDSSDKSDNEEAARAEANAARARTLHPTLMVAATVVAFFGVQGGTGGLLLLDKPLQESEHARTAVLVLFLLLSQSLLASLITTPQTNQTSRIDDGSITNGGGGDVAGVAREVHAAVGLAAMILVVVHALLGLQLGLSF